MRKINHRFVFIFVFECFLSHWFVLSCFLFCFLSHISKRLTTRFVFIFVFVLSAFWVTVLFFILFFCFIFCHISKDIFAVLFKKNDSSLSHEHFSKDPHGSGIWEKYTCMMLSRFSLLHPFESVTKPQKHRHYNPNTQNGCLKNVADIFHIL